MNIKNKNVWIAGSGDKTHDLSDFFLHFGFFSIGPGDNGKFDKVRYKRRNRKNESMFEKGNFKNGKFKKNSFSSLKLFSDNSKVKIGDCLILRHGKKRILAIGKIKSDYQYDPNLKLFNWDVQHYRYVRWSIPLKNLTNFNLNAMFNFYNVKPKQFKKIIKKYYTKRVKLCKFPKGNTPKSKSIKLLNFSKNINKIIDYYYDNDWKDYKHKWKDTEMDAIHFLVLPFFKEVLKLDYKQIHFNQHIKKCKGFADMVICKNKSNRPVCVVEAKLLDKGLGKHAKEQTHIYAKNLGAPNFIVTDGQFYYLYKTSEHTIPIAYIDIDSLFEHHCVSKKILGCSHFIKKVKKIIGK